MCSRQIFSYPRSSLILDSFSLNLLVTLRAALSGSDLYSSFIRICRSVFLYIHFTALKNLKLTCSLQVDRSRRSLSNFGGGLSTSITLMSFSLSDINWLQNIEERREKESSLLQIAYYSMLYLKPCSCCLETNRVSTSNALYFSRKLEFLI